MADVVADLPSMGLVERAVGFQGDASEVAVADRFESHWAECSEVVGKIRGRKDDPAVRVRSRAS